MFCKSNKNTVIFDGNLLNLIKINQSLIKLIFLACQSKLGGVSRAG